MDNIQAWIEFTGPAFAQECDAATFPRCADRQLPSGCIARAVYGALQTIAEGVEDGIQLRYLKEHGCDKVQGFLISKPLTEEDAILFFSRACKLH